MEDYHRRLEDAERAIIRLDTMLRGDGNGIKGFMARLFQVERYIESQTWLMRTLIGAVAVDIMLKIMSLLGIKF